LLKFFLAAEASLLRESGGKPITESGALIECAKYGSPGRNSDPNIGYQVNNACVNKKQVTIHNPVGLYISRINTSSWTLKGKDISGNIDKYVKYVRGTPGYGLRAVVEVPPDEGFVSDIEIGGIPVQYGGDIISQLDMVLYADVGEYSQPLPPAVPCGRKKCTGPPPEHNMLFAFSSKKANLNLSAKHKIYAAKRTNTR